MGWGGDMSIAILAPAGNLPLLPNLVKSLLNNTFLIPHYITKE